MRLTWLLVPLLLLISCSDDALVSTAVTMSEPVVVGSSPNWGTIADVIVGDTTAEICAAANRVAYAHADALGYWNHQLTAEKQLVYFQVRSDTVRAMVESIRSLGDAAQVNIDDAVAALGDYDDWLRAQIEAIEGTGDPVSEDHGGILDTVRGDVRCPELFDMS